MRADGVEQRLAQALVELHDVHVRGALGQVLREHAQTAADLQHHVLGCELRGAGDHAEDVRVDQEVLAEVAIGANPETADPPEAGLRGLLGHRDHGWAGADTGGAQPNRRAALRSTAAPSSLGSTPRSAAMNRSVCAT